jgi:TolB-like protein
MSSDPEQDYFADGLAEDLITDLSKVTGLFVIARNSSFIYKGKPVDIRSIAKDLGVRYVVEGSVRRASDRVRINAQLIDAKENAHLWADRFDRDLAEIFRLQDEVVQRIVTALSDVLAAAPAMISRRAANLEAYDLFVRGRALVAQLAEGNRRARPLLQRSIELDPGFAEAHAWLAMSHHFSWAYWGEAKEHHLIPALTAAQRAVSLDAENAVAHAILGDVLIFDGRPDEGAAELAAALRLNPNHADAWAFLGELKAFQGSPTEGIADLRKALRLNPHPPDGTIGFLDLLSTWQVDTRMPSKRFDTRQLTGWGRNGFWQRAGAARTARRGQARGGGISRIEPAYFRMSGTGLSATQPFGTKKDGSILTERLRKGAGLPKLM